MMKPYKVCLYVYSMLWWLHESTAQLQPETKKKKNRCHRCSAAGFGDSSWEEWGGRSENHIDVDCVRHRTKAAGRGGVNTVSAFVVWVGLIKCVAFTNYFFFYFCHHNAQHSGDGLSVAADNCSDWKSPLPYLTCHVTNQSREYQPVKWEQHNSTMK